MKTFKKVAEIVIDVLIVLIIVGSIFAIVANASRGESDVPQIFGHTFSSVQSDSMTGTFEKGDMIVGKIVDENTVIEEDDIISFYEIKGNVKIINTHRVVRIEEVGSVKWYYTQGDKEGLPEDVEAKSHDQVVAVYQFRLMGVGAFVDFLREPAGFILIVVLPIVLVILWESYRLISLYMEYKKDEYMQKAKQTTAQASEEEKAAIIQEYLNSINAGKAQNRDADNVASSEKSDQ